MGWLLSLYVRGPPCGDPMTYRNAYVEVCERLDRDSGGCNPRSLRHAFQHTQPHNVHVGLARLRLKLHMKELSASAGLVGFSVSEVSKSGLASAVGLRGPVLTESRAGVVRCGMGLNRRYRECLVAAHSISKPICSKQNLKTLADF